MRRQRHSMYMRYIYMYLYTIVTFECDKEGKDDMEWVKDVKTMGHKDEGRGEGERGVK